MTNDNRDPRADAKAGRHLIGDARTVLVFWSADRFAMGWHWHDVDQPHAFQGGPFDTSDYAWAAALLTLG